MGHIPAKKYIPGGKTKLCEILEEIPSFKANNAANPLLTADMITADGSEKKEGEEDVPWTIEMHPNNIKKEEEKGEKLEMAKEMKEEVEKFKKHLTEAGDEKSSAEA